MSKDHQILEKIKLFFRIVLALGVFYITAFALEIEPVGSIEDSLFAPTSLDVQEDELAVLEPYSKELKIFSADGVLTHKVQLTGDAYGLTKISRYLYLYCDRDRKKVVAVNAVNGQQYDYYNEIDGLTDPIDILSNGNEVAILDAANSTIFIMNDATGISRQIKITNEEGAPIRYLSSFAYSIKTDQYYLLDQIESTIRVVSSNGQMVKSFGSFGNGDGQITRGGELAVDADGRVYVTDRYQGIVLVYNSEGTYLDEIEAFKSAVAIPTGIAIDDNGVLYIASTMGLGVTMYFVAPQRTIDNAVFLHQQYPESNALLRSRNINFIGLAESSLEADQVTGFDFQVLGDTLQSIIAAEISNVSPEVNSNELERKQYTAKWQPDTELEADQKYFWRIRIRSNETIGSWSSYSAFATTALPIEYHLEQNYPNPFNPSTHIGFSLAIDTKVTLDIYNLLGQHVTNLVDLDMTAGRHEIVWDGEDSGGEKVATGVYFYRLTTNDFVQTRKMVLVK